MSFVHRVDELVEKQENALTGKADHWERIPLGAVAKVVNGFPFPSGGFNTEEGEPVVRIRDVTSGTIGTLFRGDSSDAPRVEQGDLVIGMDGDFNCRLWPGPSALLNQRVCKVVPNEAHYSKAFLSYVIPGYLKLVNDHTSAVTVKHLSSGTVHDLPLPLPPRPEQDRLVSKLDELFSRIDEGERALERVQKLVERYRQSVLKAAVTGELTRDWREENQDKLELGEALLARILKARREAWEKSELEKMKAKGITPANDKWKQKYQEPVAPDTADLPDLPTGWAWASAESVCASVHSGTTPERSLFLPTASGGVPFVKVYNLTFDGSLDFSVDPSFVEVEHHRKHMGRSRTLPGDVLTNIVGPPLGKVSVVPPTFTEWNINQAIVGFRLLSGMRNDLLSIYLQSQIAKGWLRSTTKTTTSQVNLAVTTCRRLPVPVPPELEQKVICELVEKALSYADDTLANIRASSSRSKALRQSVLKAAFCGELESQDPTDEPAATLLARIAAEREAAPVTPKRGRTPRTANV
jgi:type I restriction enzyme, S subunit